MKKLTRVNEGKIVSGVCTGIGRYFNIDPTVVRIGVVVLTCMGGSGILAYLAAAVLMPADDSAPIVE